MLEVLGVQGLEQEGMAAKGPDLLSWTGPAGRVALHGKGTPEPARWFQPQHVCWPCRALPKVGSGTTTSLTANCMVSSQGRNQDMLQREQTVAVEATGRLQ